MKLYQQLAQLVGAYHRCVESKNETWQDKHADRVVALVKERMPSGSGFDTGTILDLDRSTEEKLVFSTSFHHMNDGGMYDGWTNHEVHVKSSLAYGFQLKVTGRDRREIKDYIAEAFHDALSQVYEPADALVATAEKKLASDA